MTRVAKLAGLFTTMTLMVACPRAPFPVTRALAGETVEGVYVSPYAYEHYIRGERAFELGRYEEAATEFELARTGPSDDVYVIARLAEAQSLLGNDRGAERTLAEGDRLAPESEALALARGSIAERAEDLPGALQHYRRAHRFAPRSVEPVLAQARVFSAMSRQAQAARVLRRYARDGDNRTEHRVEVARAELELAVTTGSGINEAATALLELSPASAEDLRRAARAALPSSPAVCAGLMELLEERERDMVTYARALIALDRKGEARAVLGSVANDAFESTTHAVDLMLEADAPELALPFALTLVEEDGTPRARFSAARVHYALGDHARATELLTSIPRQARDYAAAQRLLRAIREAETEEGDA